MAQLRKRGAQEVLPGPLGGSTTADHGTVTYTVALSFDVQKFLSILGTKACGAQGQGRSDTSMSTLYSPIHKYPNTHTLTTTY